MVENTYKVVKYFLRNSSNGNLLDIKDVNYFSSLQEARTQFNLSLKSLKKFEIVWIYQLFYLKDIPIWQGIDFFSNIHILKGG